MQAIRIHFTDDDDKLVLEEIETPSPGIGEVLIRNRAIGLNRADLYRQRTVEIGQQEPPRIPGRDIAGYIESIGPGVTNLRTGDPVMALVRGGYAEFSVSNTSTVYPIPTGMSMEAASSIPCVFLTAWYAFKMAGLQMGETALIHAAGSGVGMAGIQIAKAMGARVLTSAGSDHRVAKGCQLGADAGINYSNQDLEKELYTLTNGEGIDMSLDTLGGATFDATLKSLGTGGRIVTVGGHTGPRSSYDERALQMKNQWVRSMGVFREAEQDRDQVSWQQMKPWFDNGQLTTLVQEVIRWPFAEEAQQMLNDRRVFGKIVMSV